MQENTQKVYIGYIYKFTNKINNKIYIGQTKDIQERYKQHLRAKDNNYFLNALRKYGSENFTFEVLEEIRTNTEEERIKLLNDLEFTYIEAYQCIAPNGYNSKSGGDNKGISEETRKKIGDASKKVWKNPEFKNKMCRLKIGENNSNYGNHKLLGHKHSEETKQKMSKNNYWKGKHLTLEMKQKISEKAKQRTGENNPNYGNHKLAGENNPMYGKFHSKDTRQKISEALKGKHWYTNGAENKLINPNKEEIPQGYFKGRTRTK